MKQYPFFSVVIPIYNEVDTISELYKRLDNTLRKYERYEVIFVNDGSEDRSLELLEKINTKNNKFKILDLSRNFGHQTAITAGIKYASGDAVIIMDGDLQDPPEILPRFLDKWQEGYQVVYAIRKKRKENIFKRFAYHIFYRIMDHISKTPIPLDSGDFGLIDRKIVDLLNEMPERNRFVRGLRAWIGFKQTGMSYERDERFSGEPKYTIKSLIKLAFDGIISFSDYPLRLSMKMGFFVSFISLLVIIFTFIQKILTLMQVDFPIPTVPGYATTVIAIFFLGGVQLIMIGFLGEYISRIFDETKQRPIFIIKQKYGFDET